MTKADTFLALAQPDEDGFSRAVPISELNKIGLGFGNGGSWCRSDGTLAKKYNVERVKSRNKIVAVKLNGFNKIPINKNIPQDVRAKITKRRCVVLDTANPECDHKDGRRDNPSDASLKDFQALSKPANNAKRQHCKKCRETDERFDARKLGYSLGQWVGNGRYMGSCTGCYWHDPFRFNQEISKDRKPV